MLPRADLQRLALWLGLPALAAIVGGALTAASVEAWYPTLAKPSWTPPSAVFGPVWTVLYALMGLAAFRVSRRGTPEERRGPLVLFVLQLGLNVAWSGLFFALRNPAAGLACILVLWGAIAATMRAFHRVDRTAAWMLAPYLAWVTAATALNASIWALNP